MPVLRDDFVEFVKQKMDEMNLNSYDIDRKSGGQIRHAAVWNIINRRVKEVKDETVNVLARALNVSPEEMHRRARGSASSPDNEDELRALDYPKGLPQPIKADAVAILETLWRRHANKGMPVTETAAEKPTKARQRKVS